MLFKVLSYCFSLTEGCVKNFAEFFISEIVKFEYDTEPPYCLLQTKLSEALHSLGYTGIDETFNLFVPSEQLKRADAARRGYLIVTNFTFS